LPTIAIINGVRLVIYPKDHLPPHLHAIFAENDAMISIATGDLLEGKLPAARLQAVRAWLIANQKQVSYVWEEIRAGRYTGGMIK
jgi:microcystin-dependent protein